MNPAEFPWGITHEGKVQYFDPYDDSNRDDIEALHFRTRFSCEEHAEVARMITRQAHKVIHELVETEDSNKLVELFLQLEEFSPD